MRSGAQDSQPAARGRFATTHWSLVVAAANPSSPEARAALAALCEAYWYPLYAFIRRQGFDGHQAQDLTQGFFTHLLEKHALDAVEQRKGRFRSFLLASCKNFLANERDRVAAQKRGGARTAVPLTIDAGDAERRYKNEPAHALTPERLFERRWALTLLDHVLDRLGDEMARTGKGPLFDHLKSTLMGSPETAYRELAAELGMTEGALKVAAHRLRRRYRELLREEIGRTVDDPSQVDEEIRDLFEALSV